MRVIHPMRLMQSVSRRIQVYQGGVEVSLRRGKNFLLYSFKKLGAFWVQKMFLWCIMAFGNNVTNSI